MPNNSRIIITILIPAETVDSTLAQRPPSGGLWGNGQENLPTFSPTKLRPESESVLHMTYPGVIPGISRPAADYSTIIIASTETHERIMTLPSPYLATDHRGSFLRPLSGAPEIRIPQNPHTLEWRTL